MPTMRRACVIALLPLLLASARADDKPDLQKILDAWKAREQKVEVFRFPLVVEARSKVRESQIFFIPPRGAEADPPAGLHIYLEVSLRN